MMTKKALLVLALPLTFSTAFARVQMIPVAEQIIQQAKKNESRYVLKNIKGLQSVKIFTETEQPENWFNLSPAQGAEGMRTEEAYTTFGLPQGEEIIVAVIDSGVDVNHEDLQGKVWINSKEIPNNGLDDDGNEFIDDVFGWNFIGGVKGMAKMVEDTSLKNGMRLVQGDLTAQVDGDSLEITRELVRLKTLKSQVEELGEKLSAAQASLLEKVQKTVSENVEGAKKIISTFSARKATYKKAEAILLAAGVAEMTLDAVRALESTDEEVLTAQRQMITLLSNNLGEARLNRVLEHYEGLLKYHYNENFNPRTIVGDTYSNQYEYKYGNNDVIGVGSDHGTHVSGIIAAVRDNALGIKGVATNVKIMAIRVVPNGDERDKDVANGIDYAVGNGARIINMSFGKAFSPYKHVVDAAVKRAQEKGVLFVHAAGNDNKNNDLLPSFPTRTDKDSGQDFNNWLEIGASSFLKGLTLPADFSNYGKKSVDFFAPGVDVLSTVPGDKYDSFSGTSMASPAAAGVAALAMSYDASLDADSVKALMIETSRRYPKLKVNLPGTEDAVLFSSLSTYGTIVDAFEAVKALK